MKQRSISSPDLRDDPDAAEAANPKKRRHWRNFGTGSLFISLLLHAILVAVGVVLIVGIIPAEKEKVVDFSARGGSSGGCGAPASLKSRQKQRANSANQVPARTAARNVASSFSLPEPDSASSLSALGALGGGGTGGLGSGGTGGMGAGAGGGTGTGTGNGAGMGVGMAGGKGLMVFGTTLNVRSIGVVMDVSGSMTRHLPKVLEELDRVAKGSPVVLHVGCGIGEAKTRPKIDAVSSPMRGGGDDQFKRFWYLYQDPFYRDQQKDPRVKVDFSRPMPLAKIYDNFATRPNTYFNDPEGPRSTADAILAKQFDNVEAIYWFADFQDRINPEEADRILKALKRRKQKLYIHASAQGTYIDVARNMISIPSGGKEIVPSADSAKTAN